MSFTRIVFFYTKNESKFNTYPLLQFIKNVYNVFLTGFSILNYHLPNTYNILLQTRIHQLGI